LCIKSSFFKERGRSHRRCDGVSIWDRKKPRLASRSLHGTKKVLGRVRAACLDPKKPSAKSGQPAGNNNTPPMDPRSQFEIKIYFFLSLMKLSNMFLRYDRKRFKYCPND
jgi:hypothetical protein